MINTTDFLDALRNFEYVVREKDLHSKDLKIVAKKRLLNELNKLESAICNIDLGDEMEIFEGTNEALKKLIIMDNKVIKVLDREHGKRVIEYFKQYCDTRVVEGTCIYFYYGIINERFDVWTIDEVIKNNAEIIELPEEKTYPRVMRVSFDNENWTKRVVFMEKCGGFLAWTDAETINEAEQVKETCCWKYAKELEPIEITLEEIAEWKGVSKEQIKIKQ